MEKVSACLTCGACCSVYRISYYWGEPVPEGYYEDTTPMYRSMKMTKDEKGISRCIALGGELGKRVACGIYENRSSTCREFKASYEDGGPHEPRCDEARAKIGLKPLPGPN